MREGMVIVEGTTEQARVFRAIGTLDFTTATTLAATIDKVREDDDDRTVVVDLAGVQFMDSAGLGALLMARLNALNAGRAFRVSSPQPAVERIMRVTGVHQLLLGGDA